MPSKKLMLSVCLLLAAPSFAHAFGVPGDNGGSGGQGGSSTGRITTIQIPKVVTQDEPRQDSEVGNLEHTYIDNSGADMAARVTDLNSLNPLVPASFQITYQTKTALEFWKTRFAGPVPPELVKMDGNKYLVNIGRLKMDPAFLHASIRITLTAHLELNGRTREKTFTRTAKFR